MKKFILNIDPNINIYQGIYVAKNLSEFNLNDNFLAFSGIGNHETFISMLKINKFKIIKDIEFPDHYKYSKKDIDNIISISKELDCKIITTEKDFMRLKENKYDDVKYIKVNLELLDEKKFVRDISKLYE